MVFINIFYFILSSIFLIVSGVFLVRSLVKISRFLGISEFSAAFIIMAFASSVPELFVGISSAISGNPGLSLGNVIGANILNLTLVSGIIIISAKKIKFKPKRITHDAYLMIASVLLIIVLYFIGNSLSRFDGFILIAFFLVNIYQIFKKRERDGKDKLEKGDKKFFWIGVFLVSLIVLFVSSSFIVRYASDLAVNFGFSEIILGLFLVSIATTLPELTFGLSAATLEHKIMAIGNQIGSVFVNSTLILGIVSLIHPITVEFRPFLVAAIFMFISAYIFVTFVKRGGVLERKDGFALILIYVAFLVVEFFVR